MKLSLSTPVPPTGHATFAGIRGEAQRIPLVRRLLGRSQFRPLQQAHGEWLLWLDSGETLSDQDAREPEGICGQRKPTATKPICCCTIASVRPDASSEQIARVRLMPNDRRIMFAGRVSESPNESLSSLRIALTGLPYVIRRGERELDTRFKKLRAQRNLGIAELEIRESGPSVAVVELYGRCVANLGG